MKDIFPFISNLIENQLPEHIRGDNPTFVAFMEAYYEWLEQQDNPTQVVHSHEETIDIDCTLDAYITWFRTKFLPQIPEDVLVDKRLLAKNIKDFYAARGSEKSYKFLFRILYDKDVDICYPKEDILRASDGKWVRDVKVFTKEIVDNDPYLFEQQTMTGAISGAQAVVDVVQLVNEGPYRIFQMFLREFEGTFVIGETISVTLSDGTVVEAEICGFVDSITPDNPGLGYNVGDIIPIIDATGNGVNALGQVAKVFDPGVITAVNVSSPGTGYRVGDPIIFDESETAGFGAIARVSAVTPDETIFVDFEIIGPHQNVVLSTVENIRIIDYGDFRFVDLGGVVSIDVIDGGQNYDVLPGTTVGQQTPSLGIPPGEGAVVFPSSDNAGAIAEIDVLNPGVGYIEDPLWPQADLTQLGNGEATADVTVSGGPFISEGFYRNFDGHISSIKYLQDGDFYQIYSYVLKVDETINRYRDIVKQVLHPAGMKLFGLVDIELFAESKVKLPAEEAWFTCVQIENLQFVGATYITEHAYNKQVKPRRVIRLQAPILIFDYKDEIIGGYDTVVLQDFVGFTQEKTNFNRQAEVTII